MESLHAGQHAGAVREKIRQKRIVEASQLFQDLASTLDEDDRQTLSEELSTVMARAGKYFNEAVAFEKGRQLNKALEKYKEVENIVIDYPHLFEAVERVDDAISLIWALQQKDERESDGPGERLPASVYAPKSKLPLRYRILIGGFFLQLVLVGAGLFYTGKLNFPQLKEQIVSLWTKTSAEEKGSSKSPLEITAGQVEKSALVTEPDAEHPENVPGKRASVKESMARDQEAEGSAAEKATVRLPGQGLQYKSLTDAEEPQQTASGGGNQEKVSREAPSGRQSDGDVYTVQPGDTLGLIALKIYGTFSMWSVIADANQSLLGNNPDMLRVGMVLSVPALTEVGNGSPALRPVVSPPVLNEDGTYTVQLGDSLSSIAQKVLGSYEKWQTIYELNKDAVTVSQPLKVGQVLRVKETARKKSGDGTI